ncbi:MAG: DUF3019 domain-containing protein [Colwellia sp.]|nr:DUF3019 domain-containing protein [Colwellia sp.]
MLTLLRIKKIKISLLVGYLITTLCLIMASNVYASSADTTNTTNTNDVAHLEVSPEQCIALRKGQKCYLEVTFSWRHPQVRDYCLVNITTNKTIKCWDRQTKGEFNFDFQSTLSHDFALRVKGATVDLAHARIPVAWVYKSSKRAKSTWRLF